LPTTNKAPVVDSQPNLELLLIKKTVEKYLRRKFLKIDGPVDVYKILRDYRIRYDIEDMYTEKFLGGCAYTRKQIAIAVNTRFSEEVQSTVIAYLLARLFKNGPHISVLPNDISTIYMDRRYIVAMAMAGFIQMPNIEKHLGKKNISQLAAHYKVPEELAIYMHRLLCSEEGLPAAFRPGDNDLHEITRDDFFTIVDSKDIEFYEF